MSARLKELGLYPFQLGSSVYFILLGLSLMLSHFHVEVTKLLLLPMPLVVSWSFALVAGGAALITGLVWTGLPITGRAIEKAGLYLVASAWSSYVVTLLAINPSPSNAIPIGQALVFTFTCVVRALMLRKLDRVMTHIAEVANHTEGS